MRDADVAVIGDGVAGLACALACARRGLRVALIGARSRAAASPAAAGILAPSIAPRAPDDPAQRFLVAARDAWPAWLESLAEESDVEVPLRLGLLDVDAGVFHERDGAVEVPALLRALDLAIEHRRVPRLETGARAVERDGATIVVDTPAERLRANHVIVAGGAWAAALSGLPSPLPVSPLAGVTAVVRGEGALGHVLYGHGGYLVPRGDAVVVGATSRDAGYDARITDADRATLAEVARALRGIDAARLEHHALGFRPMTPDGLPILGRDARDPRLLLATGYSRNGILLAPLAASCVAALVAGAEPPMPLAPFALARFDSVVLPR